MNGNVVGFVLNDVTGKGSSHYGSYRSRYSYYGKHYYRRGYGYSRSYSGYYNSYSNYYGSAPQASSGDEAKKTNRTDSD